MNFSSEQLTFKRQRLYTKAELKLIMDRDKALKINPQHEPYTPREVIEALMKQINEGNKVNT